MASRSRAARSPFGARVVRPVVLIVIAIGLCSLDETNRMLRTLSEQSLADARCPFKNALHPRPACVIGAVAWRV